MHGKPFGNIESLEPDRAGRARIRGAQPLKVVRMGLLLFSIPIGGITLYVVGVLATLPSVDFLADEDPIRTAYMARHAAEAGLPPDAYRTSWTNLDDISRVLVQSIIEAEDSRFYRHEGVYWRGTRKATQRYLTGQATGGASTITQQLARNLFLHSNRSPHRKVREILLAMRLERTLPKARILELYVNVIEWGDGIWGIGPAAGHYFDTTPRQLGVLESAFLASIVPAPRRALSGDNLERALRVQERVLDQLRESGKIRDSEWNDVTARLFGLQVALATGHELPDTRSRPLPIALESDRRSGTAQQPGC